MFRKIMGQVSTITIANTTGDSNNDAIIDSIISPLNNPVLIIRVTWPNDKPDKPGSTVRIYSRQENTARQELRLCIGN